MLYEKHLSREEALYRQFQQCLASLNRAWSILSELESQPLSGALAAAAVQMALIEYAKPFRESATGEHKRHSLGLPLASEDDHLLHRYLLELRDLALAHSATTWTGTGHYLGQNGEAAAAAIPIVELPELPPLADIKALIERVLEVFYAQLPLLQQRLV
jgi:hypothetical protein